MTSCSTCKRQDPPCGFSPSERRCRECCNERARAYYQTVRDDPAFQQRNRARAGAWAEAHRDLSRAKATRKRIQNYGLSVETYAAMWDAQGGLCAICGSPETVEHRRGESRGGTRQLAIDHNHACCRKGKACERCRRDLLCFSCNTGLGKLEAHWDKATAYLQRHGVIH